MAPDADVAETVNIVTLCREFHVLPKPGGLLDQPWVWVQKLGAVVEAQNEADNKKRELQQKKSAGSRRSGAAQPKG